MDKIKIIECPRDAWQGLAKIIPTDTKVAYLRKLIEAGFRHIDAVSFVAPKYVPQTADSEAVMMELMAQLGSTVAQTASGNTPSAGPEPGTAPPESLEIIGIVVNEQGLERALATPGVSTLGYPYSVSARFRRQNANMSLSESRRMVERLHAASRPAGRNLGVYISMAFGNPYDEPWGPEVIEDTLDWLREVGIQEVSLADTAGVAGPKEIAELFDRAKPHAQGMELGLHLHSRPEIAAEKVMAAYEAGCRRFDGALTGLGGCPFAGDDLVGNIPTEVVIGTLNSIGAETGIEPWAMLSALDATKELRGHYGEVPPAVRHLSGKPN
jgi:hydroxymethylglutaryl-CoA lyase